MNKYIYIIRVSGIGKSAKSKTYKGDITKQYANGSYAEVWFKEATVGPSIKPRN